MGVFVNLLFQYDGIKVEETKSPKPKPDPNELLFGKSFTDHMLTVEWSAEGGWDTPKIIPYQNLSLPPSTSTFHYAIEVRQRECIHTT